MSELTSENNALTVEEPQLALFFPGTNHTYLDKTARRSLGAYYTPQSVSDYLADWAIRRNGDQLLEPSFGDGSFLHAAAACAGRKALAHVALTGVELNPDAVRHLQPVSPDVALDLQCDDFLNVPAHPVDAVLGNPPYVRLRQLPPAQQVRAMHTTLAATGQVMDPAGSLWMPFVHHALSFLKPGGRLGFVLPYDFTYVRYARPLWALLGQRFGSLRVVRTHERLFGDIYQEVVLLLADGYGQETSSVAFEAYERVSDLLAGRPQVRESLLLTQVVAGERVFLEALLAPALRRLLAGRVAAATVPARELVTFNIGYVSGDKHFFHPTPENVAAYALPASCLRPALTTARMIKGAGLWASGLDSLQTAQLYSPGPGHCPGPGETTYIKEGEKSGVAARYKCRIRKPWYVVPGTKIPDLVLSVFSERPLLVVNDARYLASNSLLCGYCAVPARAAQLAAAWYTSLTLLQCELEVHALGGGVMVLVPGEAGAIRMPQQFEVSLAYLQRLNELLRAPDSQPAYCAGDAEILQKQLGFTEDDVELIRQGAATLTHWRTSARYAGH